MTENLWLDMASITLYIMFSLSVGKPCLCSTVVTLLLKQVARETFYDEFSTDVTCVNPILEKSWIRAQVKTGPVANPDLHWRYHMSIFWTHTDKEMRGNLL